MVHFIQRDNNSNFSRQLPPPLPTASGDKAEYVNGMVQDQIKRSTSLDCLNENVVSAERSTASDGIQVSSSVDLDLL